MKWFLLGLAGLSLFACSSPRFSSRQEAKNGYVWLTRYEVKTLDPAAIQDWTTGKVLSYLYPSIGKLCESISDSKATIFTLKLKDVKFSNDETVTSEDVAFTLRRCLTTEVQSGVGNQFASQIAGAIDYANKKASDVVGIKVVDPKTLTITLDKPDVAFKYKLSNSAFGVVNHNLVKLTQPISDFKPGYGAGDYTLESFEIMRQWVLKNRVTSETLKFQFVGDSATRRNVFDTGGADYAMFAPHEINSVRGHKMISKGGPTTLVYLQVNPKTQPSLDRAKRFQLALLCRLVSFETLFDNAVTTAPVGFLSVSSMDRLPFQLDAGTKPSPELTVITFAEIGLQNPAVEAIVTAGRKAGWNIKGQAMQSAAMLEKNSKGELPILFTGWQPDFDGPLNTLPMLFHSKSSENHSGFKNAQVDQLLEKAQRGEDTTRNIQKANQLIEMECPCIPLYVQRDLVLERRKPPESR